MRGGTEIRVTYSWKSGHGNGAHTSDLITPRQSKCQLFDRWTRRNYDFLRSYLHGVNFEETLQIREALFRSISLEINLNSLIRFESRIYNLLRWKCATSRIFSPKVAIFSQFWVYLIFKFWVYITQVKQMIDLLLLSNFCPVISLWQIQNDILTNYCLYTVWSLVMVRKTNCQRKKLIFETCLSKVNLN